jgi:hypothetical protein
LVIGAALAEPFLVQNNVMHLEHGFRSGQEPRWFLIALRETARRKQNVVGGSALLTYTRACPGLAEKDAGRWEMGDGRWEMGDGRWEMGDGRWEMGDGRWEIAARLEER